MQHVQIPLRQHGHSVHHPLMQFFILQNPSSPKQFCCFDFSTRTCPALSKIFCYGLRFIQQLAQLMGVQHDRLTQVQGGMASNVRGK